jgi:hypothetical protein
VYYTTDTIQCSIVDMLSDISRMLQFAIVQLAISTNIAFHYIKYE